MASRVVYTDRGLSKLGEQFAEFHGLSLRVGIPGGEYADGLPVAQVAAYQEYGTITIPARSFLRRPLYNKRYRVAREMSRFLTFAVRGHISAIDALRKSGALASEIVRDAIRSGDFRPLAPSTVAKKGHAHPLIDSGKLLSSIGFRIDKHGTTIDKGK